MPQLRDSSSRGGSEGDGSIAGAADQAGLPGHEHVADFARVFGIETEYGISVTQTQQPVEAAEVARTMFEPVVSRQRATNVYLANGARLYLDVGSHPEYAGAEARTPTDAMFQDAAGEQVIAGLARDAQTSLAARLDEPGLRLHAYKNNRDAAGNSFGCHENYLLRRSVPLPLVEQVLIPFLASRLLWAGAGRVVASGGGSGSATVEPVGTVDRVNQVGQADQGMDDQFTGSVAGAAGRGWRFELSQRADILDEVVSSSTTRSRPMINTRDEPHASPELFRRLHVIVADSNRSQTSTWLRLATTHLVLCLIEQAAREQAGGAKGVQAEAGLPEADEAGGAGLAGGPAPAAEYVLSDRLAALLAALPAACAEPTALMRQASQGQAQALRDTVLVQRLYCDAVTEFAQVHRPALLSAGSLSATELDETLYLWDRVVRAAQAVCQPDSVEAVPCPPDAPGRSVLSAAAEPGAPLFDRLAAALPDWVEWAAKLRVIRAFERRHPEAGYAAVEQLDLSYHDVSRSGVYEALASRGEMPLRRSAIELARIQLLYPPTRTRAALRGAFVTAALQSGLEWSCDWTHCEVTIAGRRHEAQLLDPFSDRMSPALRALFAALHRSGSQGPSAAGQSAAGRSPVSQT